MNFKHDQIKEIKYYRKLLYLFRYNKFLFKFPFKNILKLMNSNHYVCSSKEYFKKILNELGLVPKNELDLYIDELKNDNLLKRDYLLAIEQGKIAKKYNSYIDRFENNEANIVNYYALIRELKPNLVVETGTASGSMTSWILSALHNNNNGKLISIDIPPKINKFAMNTTINKSDLGFLIPIEYRAKWELNIGDAKILLPKILVNNDVDIFIHDSLHTRSHMLFEYNVAKCLMKQNKIILSDDILWNKAFFSFIKSHNLRGFSCITNPNLGFVINKFDDYELELGIDVVK